MTDYETTIIDSNPHENEVFPLSYLLKNILDLLVQKRGAAYNDDIWNLGQALLVYALKCTVENDPHMPRETEKATWTIDVNENTQIKVTMPIPEYTGKAPDLTEEDVKEQVKAAKKTLERIQGIKQCGLKQTLMTGKLVTHLK